MKNWSIKRKLTLLSFSLLAMIVLIGSVEHFGARLITSRLNEVTEIHLPAVRFITLVDMMHDGLRSIVYRALLIAQSDNNEEKKVVVEELKRASEDMAKYISEIDHLRIQVKTQKTVNKVKPEIESYLKKAEAVVGLSLAGRHNEVKAKINDFNNQFELLERDLGDLGELIEADALGTRKEAMEESKKMRIVSFSIILFALGLGSLLSYTLVRDLVRSLSKIVSHLKRSSQEVLNASSQSSNSATELSDASTEQASSIQETMASVEQISAMVNQNAESASRVKSAVDTNKKATDEGSRSVNEMLAAIDEIKETNGEILGQMESSTREFSEIVKIIGEIGEKTKVINDIVFQTKLLSFNASVEAARAGEHGKGFAVVAEEVGNLAQMSGNAAKEITDMLSSSTRKVNDIVQDTSQRVDRLVEVGKDKIAMGQATAKKCQEAFERISENAGTVASMVSEIANASKEQAQGIQEINKAIGQLDRVTQQNASVAQQSSSQAGQLKTEADSLSHAVNTLVLLLSGRSKEEPLSYSENAKVIPFPNLVKEKIHLSSTPQGLKQASGHDSVPLSSDAGFEDF